MIETLIRFRRDRRKAVSLFAFVKKLNFADVRYWHLAVMPPVECPILRAKAGTRRSITCPIVEPPQPSSVDGGQSA
jgi:hypothetical protein